MLALFTLVFALALTGAAAPARSGSKRGGRRDRRMCNPPKQQVSKSATVNRVYRPSSSSKPVEPAPVSTSVSVSRAPAVSSAAPQPSSAPSNGPTSVWQPAKDTTWQIILSNVLRFNSDGSLTPDVQAYDVDLFNTEQDIIDGLHAAGKKVICYFSAGTFEHPRPDLGAITEADKGNKMSGWDEIWLDVRSPTVRSTMAKRVDLAAQKKCDAIDPDNVDAYGNNNGLGLTEKDAADFIKFLAAQAKSHNMAIGLKNADAIIPDVLDDVQFMVNEECGDIGECDLFAPFTDAGKPVFNIEYPAQSSKSTAQLCAANKKYGFMTVLKNLSLDGPVTYCDGSKFTTPTVPAKE